MESHDTDILMGEKLRGKMSSSKFGLLLFNLYIYVVKDLTSIMNFITVPSLVL